MAFVRAVIADIAVEKISGALMHEHPASLVPGEDAETYLSGGRRDDRIEMAVRALHPLEQHGINTVVSLTGAKHVGRSWPYEFLRELSRRSGINIVAGFAYYTERAWPSRVAELSLDALAESFVSAADHLPGSSVRAGVYGEVGTGFNAISEGEERCLRAVAEAQRHTGLAIMTHASLGTMALEQVDILARAGADLEQVVIGHLDLDARVDYIEQVLRRGVTAAFDTLGKEHFDYTLSRAESYEPGNTLKRAYFRSDEARLDCLTELIRRGWQRQLVLSLDMSGSEAFMNPITHGRYGYSFLPERILPALLARGVDEDAIQQILVENPRAVLAVRDR